MCSSFLIAWTPYAIVSLYSALTAREEHTGEDGGTALTGGMSAAGAGHGGGLSDVFGFPFLINWTSSEHFGDAFGSWRNMTSDHSHHSVGHHESSSCGFCTWRDEWTSVTSCVHTKARGLTHSSLFCQVTQHDKPLHLPDHEPRLQGGRL